jgi:hypothetical protein
LLRLRTRSVLFNKGNHMKKHPIFMISFIVMMGVLVFPFQAMKRELEESTKEAVYKPTIAMTNPETGEGYLAGMPPEIKAHIITMIYAAQTLTEAEQAI